MKLRKILAGAMALVMVAGSLLVGPVETKAAPIDVKPEVAGYGWWNDINYGGTEPVTLKDGDEVVWTINVNANIGPDGAIYLLEGTTNGIARFHSCEGPWGENVTDITSTFTEKDYTLIQAGKTYEITLTREGNRFNVVHKNITDNKVIIEEGLTVTDCPVEASFRLWAQVGELDYEIAKNGEKVDLSSLRGYAWWNNSIVAKSETVALADGATVIYTFDVKKNIAGNGAIIAIESLDGSTEKDADGKITGGRVAFMSPGDAFGEAVEVTKQLTTTDDSFFPEGGKYNVTLVRSGKDITATWSNASTGAVLLEQSLTVKNCPEVLSFYAYVQYGEVDCTITVPTKSIEVSGANDKVVAGSTVQLSASVFPANTTDDNTITWSSSDTTKATVDNTGKVTGVAEGKVTITAKVSDTIVDTYEVEVQALQIPITGIELTTDKTEIKVGATAQLTTTIAPADTTDDKTVTYTSSDEKIATVDANGKVTAVKPGTVTITAKVGTFTDTVEITVPVVKITDIKLTVDKTDLEKGDIVNVVATVNPADTTEDKTITWTSSNEKVAKVDANGTVTAVGGGNATITAKAGDVTAEVKFKVTAQETVVKKTEIADVTVGAFLEKQTDGVELKKGHTYTFTFKATGSDAASTNLYETASYFIYTNSENKFNTADYKELIFTRGDVWCWFNADTAQNPDKLPESATFTRTFPENWDNWTAAMKAGAECKIIVKYDGKTITATYSVADANTVASFPVTIPSGSKLYLGLTGEKVAVTDIVVADEYVKTITGTGDVTMVLPILLVMFGGAVVIVASKKRFA